MPSDIPQTALKKESLTLKDMILAIKGYINFLISKWWIILGVTVIGVVIGFFVGKNTKPLYQASTTFLLQEAGSGGVSDPTGGGLALLGLDGGKKAGLFEGENLKWLYSTRLMLQKALCTTVKKGNNDILLINWFLDIDKNAHKAVVSNPTFKALKFTEADADSVSNQDKNTIINMCVNIINQKYLRVKDLDKTEGVIEVTITSPDEIFAKGLADVLVDNVNKYYVQSKIGKLSKHVNELQQQVDDYNVKMNASLYKTAEAVDAVPYPNPNNQVNLVAPKRKEIDAELNSNIYIQLVKSLETSKMELQKATPLINVIDEPILPLARVNKTKEFFMMFLGILGFGITVILLIVKRVFKGIMAS